MRALVLILVSMLVLLVLTGCAPQSGAVTVSATGLTGRYGDQAVISRDVHHVLIGHVIEATRDGRTVRALVIAQRRDSVHRLRFSQAWADGVELPFAATGGLDGCSHGQCRDNHAGMILLSDALFAHARAHGLRARLIGGQANVDIAAPASLFALSAP